MTEKPPEPPVAAVQPHAIDSPNGSRSDPYYWLRDDERSDAKVLEYLKAENSYFERSTAHLKAFENSLYQEIVARLKQDDSSVPYFKNGWFYSTRFDTGAEHPIFVRRLGSLDAPEQILIDANLEASGHEFYQIGALEISPDGNWMAWCEDTVGRRQFTLCFKHLPSGIKHASVIGNVEADVAWANDNRTVLYVEKDAETLLGRFVKKHVLPSDVRASHAGDDALVFSQTDLSFYTGVSRSKSDAYLFIHMESTVASEWRFARADDPKLEFEVFLAHERDHEYDIEHLGDCFIVRTNFSARNFRLARAPIEAASDKRRWVDVVPHRQDVLIEDFEVFQGFAVLAVRAGGLSKLVVKPWDGAEHFIAGDDPAYSMGLSVNPEMDTRVVRYVYTSLTTPASVYDYDVDSRLKVLKKRDPVLGDFDPKNYRSEFIFVPARDGTMIPVSLVYASNIRPDGTAPLLQYGYGAYGMSMDPGFSSTRLSLLNRGFVFAIAHVRGGQEMGRAWYDDGRLFKKKNSFTDFIDVTEALVERGYGAKDKMFAMGGSAGGLLMGAVANMAGMHYRGIVAQVPFVDVVSTMLDDSIPLTSNEYDEWGNPNEARFYSYMLEYSPYDNIEAKDYPAMLVTTGLFDSQVQYYEPAKWVAKLRALKTGSHPLLLHVEMEAGHGGKSGRFQRYREIAREYVFILDRAGISE